MHTESRSREMFTACDGDGDDRLDLFEACEAIETLGDPRDGAGFRRLDLDRDGFLTWPEFDRHFRGVVDRGLTFRVRTCRKLAAQPQDLREAAPLTRVQKFLRLHDQNGDGGLDPDEIDQFVRQARLPPAIGTHARGLDHDGSGRVEETELAPLFDLLRGGLAQFGPPAEPPRSPLPPAFAPMDEDGNGEIDLPELTRALRRIDPALARWAAALLPRLDRDRNGRLGAAELPGGAVAPQR
ncbi:MAG: hypothetical protein FJ265_18075 [Planctomycetes bacterium]|nr:hypothetical protein [Planctomycetota bacterium]